MIFSQNYSPELAELIGEGLVQVDRLKCPEWPDLVATAKGCGAVYVHFRLLAGQGLLSETLLDEVARFRDETDTPYINTHIAVRYQDIASPDDKQGAIDAVTRDVMQLVDRFGAEFVIAENIPFPEHHHGRDKPYLTSDPDVIRAVIEQTGVGLLLDLGHARRTAEHLAIDPRLYIAQLPTDRLREIHITGLGYSQQGERVDHLPMKDEDWELLQWALDNVRDGHWATPWSVSCEYGGIGEPFRWRSKKEVIAVEAPRMYAMVRAAKEVREVN